MRAVHVGCVVVAAAALLGGTGVAAAYAQLIPVATIADGTDGFAFLGGLTITTHDISGRTYALMVDYSAVQIVDITDPAEPLPVAVIPSASDSSSYSFALQDIAIHDISNKTYALVHNLHVVQMVDITDPAEPLPVAFLPYDSHGFTTFSHVTAVDAYDVSGGTYAVVAGRSGVQIINITHPDNPVPVASALDDVEFLTSIDGVDDVIIHEVAGRTYAFVTTTTSGICATTCNNFFDLFAIDITDPAEPLPASPVRVGWMGHGIAVHDISNKTYTLSISREGSIVHVADITDPADVLSVYTVRDDVGGFTDLGGADDIAIHDISNRTYAVVASPGDDGAQIIDITRPADPIPVAVLTDGTGDFTTLGTPYAVAIHDISNRTYAIMLSSEGLQIVDITGLPDMSSSHASAATDVPGVTKISHLYHGGPYGAYGVAVHNISNRTYALVADGGAVRISDVTHPAEPLSVAAIHSDGDGFPEWLRPAGITTRDISNKAYAFVTASDSVQIMDITHPGNSTSVAIIRDDVGGFTALDGVTDIAIHDIADRTYALVSSKYDSGVQIMDVTHPDNPLPVAAIPDDADEFAEMGWAYGIAVHDISNRTYAFVTHSSDSMEIIDVTQPYSPLPVATVTGDTDGFIELRLVQDVAVHDISNRTYAFAAISSESGMEIIDVTQPHIPFPAAAAMGDADGSADLKWTDYISIHDISNRTYAFMVRADDFGMEIIDVTHPANTLSVGDLAGGNAMAVHDISNRTYAFAAPAYGSVVIMDVTDMAPDP